MAPHNICAASREAPQWRNLLTARKQQLQLPLMLCVCVCGGGSAPVKGGQSSLLSREGGYLNVKWPRPLINIT